MTLAQRVKELEKQVQRLELMIMAHRAGFVIEQWDGDEDTLRVCCQEVLNEVRKNPWCNRELIGAKAAARFGRKMVVNGHFKEGEGPEPPEWAKRQLGEIR